MTNVAQRNPADAAERWRGEVARLERKRAEIADAVGDCREQRARAAAAGKPTQALRTKCDKLTGDLEDLDFMLSGALLNLDEAKRAFQSAETSTAWSMCADLAERRAKVAAKLDRHVKEVADGLMELHRLGVLLHETAPERLDWITKEHPVYGDRLIYRFKQALAKSGLRWADPNLDDQRRAALPDLSERERELHGIYLEPANTPLTNGEGQPS